MTGSRSTVFAFLSILLSFQLCFSHDSTETNSIEGETILEEYLVCRSCGSDSALSNHILYKISPKSLAFGNETLFGKEVAVQLLENPLGARYEVIAIKRANCARIGGWSSSLSWFPGYAWKLCLCPACGAHIGWMFEPTETGTSEQAFPSEKGFYLIVLSNIIGEKEIKNLLVSGYAPNSD